MPVPRFRIRTLMIVVAVAAVLSWGMRTPLLAIAAMMLLIVAVPIAESVTDHFGPHRRPTPSTQRPRMTTWHWTIAVAGVSAAFVFGAPLVDDARAVWAGDPKARFLFYPVVWGCAGVVAIGAVFAPLLALIVSRRPR